eukprot:GHUV01043442.1.p1 GENE.GHUV01043442.1~~GHUV01043442.1.p1  ORF type:complete len:165 (+),score=47.76 GHUV01043442.1:433-927(+)
MSITISVFPWSQADETAYLLDYAGPEGFPQQLAQHVQGVYVLDHHKTAAAQLADTSSHPPNLHVHIDMQRSGAMLARDWFNPAGVSSQLQQVFEWVQDADLWSWKLPDSRAFHAGLAAQNLEYSALKNPPNLHVHIDMQRSGAMLARDWFNPAGVSSQLQQVFE